MQRINPESNLNFSNVNHKSMNTIEKTIDFGCFQLDLCILAQIDRVSLKFGVLAKLFRSIRWEYFHSN